MVSMLNPSQSRSGGRVGVKEEPADWDEDDAEPRADGKAASPGRSRKAERPQRVPAGGAAGERRGSPAGGASAERRGNQAARAKTTLVSAKTQGGVENVKKEQTNVRDGAVAGKKSTPVPVVPGQVQPVKMSQKIQEIVQNDVENILQMVQGNKVQTSTQQATLGGKRSDEVVILVVGENKKFAPVKSITASGTAAQAASNSVKISLAPKIISAPVSGATTVLATASSGGAASLASRGVVTVARNPVKILPKPTGSLSQGKISIFEKLAAAKQLKPGTSVSIATVAAPVATVTAGNRSPRRQQSAQK